MNSPVSKDVTIAALESKLETYQKIAIDMQDRYHEQLKINRKLIECVEFYANTADLFEGYNDLNDFSMVSHGNVEMEVLGKRARQVLKELSD